MFIVWVFMLVIKIVGGVMMVFDMMGFSVGLFVKFWVGWKVILIVINIVKGVLVVYMIVLIFV